MLMLAELNDAFGPLASLGKTPAVKLTAPENVSMLPSVIVDLPGEPTMRIIEVGFADMKKSPVTNTLTIAEWTNEPFVAITVTRYDPVGVEIDADTVSIELATPPEETVTLLGFNDAVKTAEACTVREISPENPSRLVAVMLEVFDEPGATVMEVGFAARV